MAGGVRVDRPRAGALYNAIVEDELLWRVFNDEGRCRRQVQAAIWGSSAHLAFEDFAILSAIGIDADDAAPHIIRRSLFYRVTP